MSPASTLPLRAARLALLATLLVTLAAAAPTASDTAHSSCASAGAGAAAPTCPAAESPSSEASGNSGPDLHVQDGFVSDELRRDLIQYLDAHEPTNPLGVVMVPAPQSLADRFLSALRGLGAASSHAGRFPELSLSAFARGSGRLPGKAIGSGSKGCHVDYEVDSGFNVDNVVGPTDGRVGILYLSGSGEFILVDEATGEETRQEIVPGRFMSWRNAGNRHCVATNSKHKRHFIGPVVLESSKAGFIPVVDILAGPAKPCNKPSSECVDSLTCKPAGSSVTSDDFCCPGAIYWSPSNKCCYITGASASTKKQCCSGRLIQNVCAPTGDLTCVSKCLKAADSNYASAKSNCSKKGGSRAKSCNQAVAAMQSMHRAYCYGSNLPTKC